MDLATMSLPRVKSGDKPAIYMLKSIQTPTDDEFSVWLSEAQEWAQSVGYTEDDVESIVKSFRSRKKYENSY